ncbi:hypothetical protein [Pseudomonas sp. FME51]|uniref:hypothetical protein n=1 Tax=Pseudomonas sp. FME51 TaxID=2742609 RepID=UPI001867F4D9|nr:hypothetical protein [Pseudomonas sp. FME51]
MTFSPSHPMHLFMGLTVWAIWFVVLYGGLSVACKVAAPDPAQGALTWINALLWFSTLLVTVLLGMAAWRCARATPDATQPNRRFIARTSAALYLLSAFATLVLAMPTWFLPPCV